MLQATRRREARVLAARDLSGAVREILIAPEGGAAPWTPGAHIDVSLPLKGGAQVRSYSLVGEAAGAYRIAVKREDGGRGGSRFMHTLAPGAKIFVSEPKNAFALDYSRPAYLLVAGGIGVTPVIGQAQALARHGAKLRVALAARTRADILFHDEFSRAVGERVECFVSSEGRRIDPPREIAGLADGGELYICGPLPLVDAFRKAWKDAGRPAHLFRTETFGSSGEFAAQPFKVNVPALQRTIEVAADCSMLDALEAAGVEMISDCRRGECGLCAVDVLASNTPLDHRDVFFSEEERREARKICACVSRAVGGEISIDTGYRPDV